MKPALCLAWMFLFLASAPHPSQADYRILLKRGTQFVVPDYQVDRESVRFEMDGGEVRIPRDKVLYINEIKGSSKAVTSVVTTIGFGRNSEYATEELKSDLEGWDAEQDKGFQEQARRLDAEYNSVMADFQTAVKEEDQSRREAAVKQILELKRKKAELYEKTRELHGGEIPSWWENSSF